MCFTRAQCNEWISEYNRKNSRRDHPFIHKKKKFDHFDARVGLTWPLISVMFIIKWFLKFINNIILNPISLAIGFPWDKLEFHKYVNSGVWNDPVIKFFREFVMETDGD